MENIPYLWEAFIIAVGTIFSIIGYYIKDAYTRMQDTNNKLEKIENELYEHKLKDAEQFVHRQELREMMTPIINKLDSIESFLRGRRNTD